MPKTQINCPNCRQPVVAEIDQLFDLNADPNAKARLLSGAFNVVQCPACGYQGSLASPLVYHDPDKELLLTFVPPELGLPRNEQERLIGSLMNQVINRLPQEKRKGYLLNPQATLTMQGLIERILEADGITREMLQAQQRRLNLIQRLAGISDPAMRDQIAQQEDALIDADFFTLLNRLVEAALMGGDRQAARQLNDMQRALLPVTTYGRQLQEQSNEIEAAVNDLRAAGANLDRAQMLELVINASSEVRLTTLVSLARPLLDYEFFQMLSERIERARGDDRTRLTELRAHLLEMTQAYDQQMAAHRQEARQVINSILQADDVVKKMSETLSSVDEIFVQELQQMLAEARQQGDLVRSSKLSKMMDALQQASAPPEMELMEQYLELEDDAARQAFLEEFQDEITPEFMEMLSGIAVQVQAGDDPEMAERAAAANRQALRFSMRKSMQQ